MSLKLVRKKKPKKATGRTKKTEVEKFADAIAVQLRIAGGETVSKGRGVAKSWMVNGDAFGQKDKVLVPMIGRLPLHSKSGYTVNMSQAKPPTNELRELLAIVKEGKLSNKIYSVIRAQKKKSK